MLLQMVLFHSLKRLRNIPSYICATHPLHPLFCRRYSGCFCVSVIAKGAAVSTGVHGSFWAMVFPGVESLDHMAALFSASSPAFILCSLFSDGHSEGCEVISIAIQLTLCNPVDCSPSGSSVHGILQAGILERVAISFSRGIFLTQGSNPGLLHCRQTL